MVCTRFGVLLKLWPLCQPSSQLRGVLLPRYAIARTPPPLRPRWAGLPKTPAATSWAPRTRRRSTSVRQPLQRRCQAAMDQSPSRQSLMPPCQPVVISHYWHSGFELISATTFHANERKVAQLSWSRSDPTSSNGDRGSYLGWRWHRSSVQECD